MGFFENIKNKFFKKKDKQHYLNGFKETSKQFNRKLGSLKDGYQMVDSVFYDNLLMILVQSDIGVETSGKIITLMKKKIKNKNIPFEEVKQVLYEAMADVYGDSMFELPETEGPLVIFLVGVNGSGKTTSAAKLANYFMQQNKKVVMVAADTFRAGAIKQLEEWAKRLDIDCISGKENGDPSAAIVDGLRYGKQHQADVILCDTAGRLQNKSNLMKELSKMTKVAGKEVDNAPHCCWLVIDGSTGQNGLSQAKVFLEATNVNGIILTKMDGTAKGGVILAIKDQLSVPVRFIGTGETLDSLREFDLDSYLYSIAEGVDNADF